MAQTRVWIVGFGMVAALAFAAAACDDASSSEFREPEPDAGSLAETGTFANDTGTGEGGGPSASCDPSLPDAFAPTWRPPTRAAACSTEQLAAYHDACTPGKLADGGDPCKAWLEANAACTSCLEPAEGNGPIQWFRGRYYYGLNVAGCLALERNEPEDGKCPSAYAAPLECQRAACDGCFASASAKYSDFQACQAAAKAGDCARYSTKLAETCEAGYAGADGGAASCFKRADEDARAHFLRVEAIFCGQ